MGADVVPYFRPQFLDANGIPLAGGKVYTYKAGTTTPLVTYNDANYTPNTNPIILDSTGCADIFIGLQALKFAIYDANDILIKTIDGVTGPSGTSVGIQTVVPITTNGSQTTFALGVDAELVQNCTVVVKPNSGSRITYLTTEYTIDGQNLTFNAAPPTGTGEIRIGHTRAIGSSGLSDGIVTTSKIQDNAVTNAKIADDAIGTSKIQNDAVTTPKIADSNVTTSKLANGVLTADTAGRAKMADGFLTVSKFAVVPKLKSQSFTAAGSWICPVGVNEVLVLGAGGGGGGGGGGCEGTVNDGGGGGGGAGAPVLMATVSVTPGATYAVTIGAGGANGVGVTSSAGSAGAAGGSTAFDALLTFPGGRGGSGGSAGNNSAAAVGSVAGGAGGTPTPSGWTELGATGGAGGGNGQAGSTGLRTQYAAGGPGGATGGGSASDAGGGGGGGSSIGAGGAGGARNGAGGNPGAAGTYGGGGGGGAGANGGGTTLAGASGGTGGSGYLKIMWVENQ